MFVASASPSSFGVAVFVAPGGGTDRRPLPSSAQHIEVCSRSAHHVFRLDILPIQVTSQLLFLVGIKSIHVVCFV
jgi:hypothetical protein